MTSLEDFRTEIDNLSPRTKPVTEPVGTASRSVTPPPAKSCLPWFRLVEFHDLAVEQSGNYLFKDLLQENGFSVIYGDPGCGKTFFVLDLSLHLALGWLWRGQKVACGPVIYIMAEGQGGIAKRIEAFKKAHNLTECKNFAVLPAQLDLADRSADTNSLIELIKDRSDQLGEPVKMIVVDTVSRVLGGADENSSTGMGAFIANIDRIREATGTHVLAVHHSGKDMTRGGRGWSGLRGAADTEVEIRRDSDGLAWAKITKQKDGPLKADMAFQLDVVELGTDEDGDPITSCVVEIADGAQAGQSDKTRRLPPQAKIALQQLTTAIIDAGKPLPDSNHTPANVQGVSEDLWRSFCSKARLADSNDLEAQAKAFRRTRQVLRDRGFIGCWDGNVWLAKQPDGQRTNPDMSGLVRRQDDRTDTDTPL